MRLPFLLSTTAIALAISLPASATSFSFSTTLSNLGEPIPTSTGTGSATVVFDDVTKMVSVDETFANLVNNASAAHIHCCTAIAGTGSVGVALGFSDFPSAKSAHYVKSFTLATLAFNNLLLGAQQGKAYLNIHSPGTYSGGEIRGFLAPVPEPAAYGMMLAGLGLLAWVAKRRQRA